MVNVLLFRAQPFHNGHLANIAKALHDALINDTEVHIFIGSADKVGTARNPLPVELRYDLVYNSIKERFGKDASRIKIHLLNDLDDEANNSYDWGQYLYWKIVDEVGDGQLIFYYSDRPDIMLSWFQPFLRDCIYFKFLERVNNISATEVRRAIKNNDYNYLSSVLPDYVYNKLPEIRKYIK